MVWTRFYAWFPVCCDDGTWVWLEHAERRLLYVQGWTFVDYRLPADK
jgi:hypothetical protein